MSKILKVTLASAMLIAGSSMGFAADRGMNGRTPNSPNNGVGAGFNDKSRSSEQQEQFKLDYGTTGSISNCETRQFDEYGNCIVDPGYQRMR